jgi:Zn-dependent metalloprotease
MGEIITYDCKNVYRIPGSIMTDTDTTFNSARQAAGVDAHYYAEKVYKYFYNTFQRNSINNNNMDIKSSVHYGSNYNNAGWTGSQMVYGDGDGVNYRAFSAAFDVVAHELTHGVTDYEANLIYQDQSGALNESFSDVFGVIIENQGGNGNWLMGEDCLIRGTAFRSVSNPSAYGDPENMNDYYYTTDDNGGVHTNSGIPNKAAFNAYNNLNRDFNKLGAIYYRALTVYLSQSSDFSAARSALVQSATDLYGSAEAAAIRSAFDAVGIN